MMGRRAAAALLLLLLVPACDSRRRAQKKPRPRHPAPEQASPEHEAYDVAPGSDEGSSLSPSGRRCGRRVAVPPDAGLLSAQQLRALREELDECGFIFFEPGAVAMPWVGAARMETLRMWAAFKKDMALQQRYATPVPAGGRRVDVVLPTEGAFNGSMFGAFSPALFQLLDDSLDTACCSLQMMVVKAVSPRPPPSPPLTRLATSAADGSGPGGCRRSR